MVEPELAEIERADAERRRARALPPEMAARSSLCEPEVPVDAALLRERSGGGTRGAGAGGGGAGGGAGASVDAGGAGPVAEGDVASRGEVASIGLGVEEDGSKSVRSATLA